MSVFDLNPAGRLQTKKYRAADPATGLLHDWLNDPVRRARGPFAARTAEDKLGASGGGSCFAGAPALGQQGFDPRARQAHGYYDC